jgi:xyloglucan-specific exo-beta-1,4-glucanase
VLPTDPVSGKEVGRAGGYMAISLDRQRPGTLVVATMNRKIPGDTVWRSTDSGSTWRSLRETSSRDVTAAPFLRWGRSEADFGWWIAGVAIDPFDSNFVAYTTGATVYATHKVASAPSAALRMRR